MGERERERWRESERGGRRTHFEAETFEAEPMKKDFWPTANFCKKKVIIENIVNILLTNNTNTNNIICF